MSLIQVNSIDVHDGESVSILSNLNLQSVPSGSCVNNLGIDASGNVIVGLTGSSSNISDAVYSVYNNLSANNTTSSTTSVCSYGVNVFTTVILAHHATKLPQPVTGKSVKIINNGTDVLFVFPSNVGGQINNLPIDTPAELPPDGKPYEFICTVNPLPGAWVFSAPAIAQYEMNEMSVAHTNGTASRVYGIGINTPYEGQGCYLDGTHNIVENTPGRNGHFLFPASGTKTKVYTNIVNGDLVFEGDEIVVERLCFYKISSTGAADSSAIDYMRFGYAAEVGNDWATYESPVGTLIPAPNQNVGDTGTFYGETLALTPNLQGRQLGTGGEFSGYYWRYAMNIPATAATKTYKFKIILEYV
jgi:hypothetical protein